MPKTKEQTKEVTLKISGDEPVVVLSLDEWRRIEELIDNKEDALRYEEAQQAKDNQGLTSFNQVKKDLNLS